MDVLDLHGEFAGRRQDQRARRLGAALGAERDDLRQDRQREGRGLAGAGLGDAQNVAAGELRRNGLGLDRLRLGEAGGNGGLEQRARNAECGETVEFRQLLSIISVFDIQFILLSRGIQAANSVAAGRNLPSKFDLYETTRRRAYRPRGCAVVPARHHPSGAFSPLPKCSEREKTDATSLQ